MKTPLQKLIKRFEELKDSNLETSIDVGFAIGLAKSLLEEEKEFVSNFATDYVISGNIGCVVWGDAAPELDIDKSARDYYNETFNKKDK